MAKGGEATESNIKEAKHEAAVLLGSRLRWVARHGIRASRLASHKYAGPASLVSTSRVASDPESFIKGRSRSSSIVRPPSCDQIRSYSWRDSSLVGRGDHSMP